MIQNDIFTMEKIKISVIVPTFNEEKAIENGSGIYDKDGKDLNPVKEEEVELNPDDQRYVNKIEERIKRQKTEIANIKKKRGSKK